jgi:hypothetical protein
MGDNQTSLNMFFPDIRNRYKYTYMRLTLDRTPDSEKIWRYALRRSRRSSYARHSDVTGFLTLVLPSTSCHNRSLCVGPGRFLCR